MKRLKKVRSINEVNLGDVLMHENLIGIVSFFADGSDVILETLVEVEIMTDDGMASLQTGSDWTVDALNCYFVLTRTEMNNAVLKMSAFEFEETQ